MEKKSLERASKGGGAVINPIVTALARFLIGPVLRLQMGISEVEVSGIEELLRLKGRRVVLMPNHPEEMEPYVLFYLSKLMGEAFFFLTAKEIFDERPFTRRFISRLGGYPVARGTADRQAFITTRDIMAEGRRWLVVFPEGEVSWQNDTLLPFHRGIFQTGFTALKKSPAGEPLFFIPLAIRYFYTGDMGVEILKSLGRLEARLFCGQGAIGGSRYERLRRVAAAVLAVRERAYGIAPGKNAPLDERLRLLREVIIERVEGDLGLKTRREEAIYERIRALFNAIEKAEQGRGPLPLLRVELKRVQRFASSYDGYVGETKTDERFIEVLGRIEADVFGRQRIRGKRRALLKVGTPLDLRSLEASYRQNKRGAVKEAAGIVEGEVRRLLAELSTAERKQ